jgi:hypothetical protein
MVGFDTPFIGRSRLVCGTIFPPLSPPVEPCQNSVLGFDKLSFLAHIDEVPLAHIPSAERRRWRSLIEYGRRLVQRRGAVKNRTRTLLRSRGEAAPRGLWPRRWWRTWTIRTDSVA